MKYLYIANWKMNLDFIESINFCKNNKKELEHLSSLAASIILCPSFIALAPIVELLKESSIAIGAQNCSEYESGFFTGEISAQSLAQVGMSYCIVGHSERRIHFGETTNTIIKKINLLHSGNIIPIICIGETQEQFEKKGTFTVLTEQLKPIIENMQQSNKQIIVAYEPVWAIGTGITPDDSYLQEVIEWITKFIQLQLPKKQLPLLYGGNVNPTNSKHLKSIPHIDGFLIGSAGTDIKQFSEIIKS